MDRAKLETVVHEHQLGVWRYLRLLGCSRELADDLTQETLLVAWRKGIPDDSPPGVAAWLRQIARFEFFNSRRSSKQRKEMDLAAVETVAARYVIEQAGDDTLAALRHCVDVLQGRARDAVLAVYRDQQSHEDVARLLGLKPNGLKTLLQRGRAALRECVDRKRKENLP